MNMREKLLQSINQAPEPLVAEALHYLEYSIDRHLNEQKDAADLADLPAIREEIDRKGTVPWNQIKQELGL